MVFPSASMTLSVKPSLIGVPAVSVMAFVLLLFQINAALCATGLLVNAKLLLVFGSTGCDVVKLAKTFELLLSVKVNANLLSPGVAVISTLQLVVVQLLGPALDGAPLIGVIVTLSWQVVLVHALGPVVVPILKLLRRSRLCGIDALLSGAVGSTYVSLTLTGCVLSGVGVTVDAPRLGAVVTPEVGGRTPPQMRLESTHPPHKPTALTPAKTPLPQRRGALLLGLVRREMAR